MTEYKAIFDILDEISNYKINANSYYEDSGYESLTESIVYSKIRSLKKYFAKLNLIELAKEIEELELEQGKCITNIEIVRGYLIPEAKRQIKALDASNSYKKLDRIVEILDYRGRRDLALLLKDAHYWIEESDSYGSYLFSVLSTVEIFSSLPVYEKLRSLSELDKNVIKEAFEDLYPPGEKSIEICDIRFLLDRNIEYNLDRSHSNEIFKIDFEYIKEQIDKCDKKIEIMDYDGAIANARSLLESICIFIIENRNSETSANGDLPKLFKETVKILNFNISPNNSEGDALKQILIGCTTIVNGLARARNILSDAHGRSTKNYLKPTKQHAILVVEVSKAVSEFIYSISLADQKIL
ncbi:MAG: abortive infection family protein [Methanothrix sp.]|nr:abortive infection family protein [Methanothrix sp.]